MNNRPFSKAKILICKMLVGTMLAYGTGTMLTNDIGPVLNGVIIPLYRRRLENDIGSMLAYGTSPMQAYGTGPIMANDIGPVLNGVIIPLYRRSSAADGRKPAIDAGPISGRLSVPDWEAKEIHSTKQMILQQRC